MITKNEAPTVAGQGRKTRRESTGDQFLENMPPQDAPVKVLGRLMRRLALWILRRHLEGRVHGAFDRRVSSALDCLETLKEVAR